jgi:ATP-dependent Clp protease ATP-binding subunit ClpC
VEDPLSENILNKQFKAGEIIVVDAIDDPDGRPGDKKVTFRAVEGFQPPEVELAAIAGGEPAEAAGLAAPSPLPPPE